MNGKQFLELLARLPARVWLQAILGLIGFVGAGRAGLRRDRGRSGPHPGRHPGLQGTAVESWALFTGHREPEPPARRTSKVIELQYDIVDRAARNVTSLGAPLEARHDLRTRALAPQISRALVGSQARP
jgi:hypothetical protein